MIMLPVSRIRTDGGTQPRVAMNESAVADYAEVLTEGGLLPDILVFHDGEAHWLADGFHRLAAAKRIGALEINAEVRQGTRRDAQLYSFGANAAHGLRRTDDDKRRVVNAMLDDEEWAAWSDRQIARACKVAHSFVRKLRVVRQAPAGSGAHLDSSPDSDAPAAEPVTRKVSRGGTEYKQRIDTINAGRVKVAADPDAGLAKELAEAEAELGAKSGEVEQLREKVAELSSEVEWLSKAVDGDAAAEIRKQAVYIATVEATRDDLQMQNAQLKKHIARLERQLARFTGEAVRA